MIAKVLVAAFALLSLIAISEAIVCPPGICETMRCPPLTKEMCEGRGGVFQPKGGFCGCCDNCPTALREGVNCFPHMFGLGLPHRAVCGHGLVCNSDYNCVRP